MNKKFLKMAKAVKGKKGTPKFKLPKPVPLGTVLKDIKKKFWCIGPSLGKGGFGEIYAANQGEKIDKKNQKYAVKIEPKENGPLFVEQVFFIKVCDVEKLNAWKASKKLKFLGIPALRGFGSHKMGEDDLRFLVMDKLGKDFWSYFLDNGKQLDVQVVSKVTLQMIDALEYIHDTGYAHGDIKGTNMLFDPGNSEKVYLVDFGLVELLTKESSFKSDPRRQHNGTIEYVSCDMHQGVPTRRSDLEILGFNIMHWLTSSLPWEGNTNPPAVFKMKQDFLNDLKAKKLKDIPEIVKDFFHGISNLGHLDSPDYDNLRKIVGKYTSTKKNTPQKRSKTTVINSKKKLKIASEDDADDSDEPAEAEAGPSKQKTRRNVKKEEAKVGKENALNGGMTNEIIPGLRYMKRGMCEAATVPEVKIPGKKRINEPVLASKDIIPGKKKLYEPVVDPEVIIPGRRVQKQITVPAVSGRRIRAQVETSDSDIFASSPEISTRTTRLKKYSYSVTPDESFSN